MEQWIINFSPLFLINGISPQYFHIIDFCQYFMLIVMREMGRIGVRKYGEILGRDEHEFL